MAGCGYPSRGSSGSLQAAGIPEGAVAFQFLEHPLPAGGVLLSDEPQAQEPGSEGILRIRGSRLRGARALLGERLAYDRHAELYVCFDLARMQGAVEYPELYRSLGVYGVQVEAVVAGIIVVFVSVPALAL